MPGYVGRVPLVSEPGNTPEKLSEHEGQALARHRLCRRRRAIVAFVAASPVPANCDRRAPAPTVSALLRQFLPKTRAGIFLAWRHVDRNQKPDTNVQI